MELRNVEYRFLLMQDMEHGVTRIERMNADRADWSKIGTLVIKKRIIEHRYTRIKRMNADRSDGYKNQHIDKGEKNMNKLIKEYS